MACVYRYIDKEDNIIKYVGIVWGTKATIQDRIRQHKAYDEWCKNGDWHIEYIEKNINTRTDAEYWEAHLISLYGTDNYFNKSKSGWGISSFLPDIEHEWKTIDLEPIVIIDGIPYYSKKQCRKETGLSFSKIDNYILGETIFDKKRGKKHISYKYKGIEYPSIKALAQEYGMYEGTISNRLKAGLTLEEAMIKSSRIQKISESNVYKYNDKKYLTLKDLYEENKSQASVTYSSFRRRVKKGIPIFESLCCSAKDIKNLSA